MAPQIEVSLTELEEAMRHAFFGMEETVNDPPISIPDVRLIFEHMVKGNEGLLKREFAAKYPNLLPAMNKSESDPLESVLRNPEKRETFLQTFNNITTTNISTNLAKVEFLEEFFKKIEPTDQIQQSDENLEYLKRIKHSLESAKASLSYSQLEMSSLTSLIKPFANLLYSDELPRAYDPSLDPAERMQRLSSTLNSLRGILPEMKSNVPGLSPTQNLFGAPLLMNQLASFMNFAQQLPTLAQDSRLPNLTDLEDYCYEALPTETSIRLLHFEQQNGQGDQPTLIKLSFNVVDLQDRPAFNALSYVWGDHRPPLNQGYSMKRAQRRFHIVCDGRKVSITYNLFCALRRLSASHNDLLAEFGNLGIWIDQLCINQADLSERSQQVAMMDRIYGEATKVISWLGEEDSHTDKAVTLLNVLASRSSQEYSDPSFNLAQLEQEFSSEQWLALSSLLSRPYFKRAWVVQEVTLANPNQLVFICGHRVILRDSLVNCSQFLQGSRVWTLLTKHAGVFRSTDEHLRLNRWRSPIRFGQQLSALLDAREAITQQQFSPEDILFLGRQFDATEVKDKFYAMLGLAKARLGGSAASAQIPPVNYDQSIEEVALAFTTYHVRYSKGLKVLSLVEDSTYRTNKNLPSWVPDPAASLLPLPLLPLPRDILDEKISTPWNACGSRQHVTDPVIDENILIVQGYRIDEVEKAAMPFNTIVENGQWSNLFELLEPLTRKEISGMTLDEAVWRTLVATTDPPFGKHVASTMGLKSEFSEWIISLLNSAKESPNFEEEAMAIMMSSSYRLDDIKFNIMAFGKEAADTIIDKKGGPASKSLLQHPSTRLLFDFMNKMEGESESRRGGKPNDHSKQLEDTVHRLWQSNPTGAFPSPDHIRETLSSLHRFKVDSPGREEIQMRINRFNAAIGMKLESRRMFVTKEGRLGLGPQTLEEQHEIWVLQGANVPFVLRRLGEGHFELVGEAFVFGAMHGEAVKDVEGDQFCKVRLK